MGLQERLELQGLQVLLDHQDHWGLLVRQVIKEALGLLAALDNRETLDHKDQKVHLGSQGNLARRGSQGIVVHLVHLDFLDLQAQLDLKDSRVIKVKQDHKDQLATEVTLDNRAIQDHLEHQEIKDQLVHQDL